MDIIFQNALWESLLTSIVNYVPIYSQIDHKALYAFGGMDTV